MRSPGSLQPLLFGLTAVAAAGCTLYDPSLLLDAPPHSGGAGQAGSHDPGSGGASGGGASGGGHGGDRATGGQGGAGTGGQSGAGTSSGGSSGGETGSGGASGLGGVAGQAAMGPGGGPGAGGATSGAGGSGGSDCVSNTGCDDHDPCTDNICTPAGACLNPPLPEGTPCGGSMSGMVCMNMVCLSPTPSTCGNGMKDPGEQCDQSTGNGPGTGCSAYCQYEPLPDELVITEVQYHPTHALEKSGVEYGEWIEIYNTSATETIDLRGLRLTCLDVNGTSGLPKTHIIADGSSTAVFLLPRAYGVLARSGDPAQNGGLSAPLYVYGSTSIALGDSNTYSVGIEIASSTPTVLDSLTYNGAKEFAGHSYSLNPKVTPTAMATADSANFCASSISSYGGGDFGTPGLPNDPCP